MGSIKHKIIKFFGGEFYEKETETTYWYPGKISFWFDVGWFKTTRWAALRYYSVRIWWLKMKTNKTMEE